jgi:PAS domain-containing protein
MEGSAVERSPDRLREAPSGGHPQNGPTIAVRHTRVPVPEPEPRTYVLVPADRHVRCAAGRGGSVGARVLRTGVPELDVRLRITRTDGGERWLSLNYEPFDRSPRALVVSFRDISEQRGAEEELRGFAALVELSSDFIARADLDLNVLYVNEAG